MLLGALAAWTMPARGGDVGPRVRLDYRAAEECPSESAFVELLGTKAAFRLAQPNEVARTITLRLSRASDRRDTGYRGTLLVEGEDRAHSPRPEPRQIGGDDCAQVASALAVILSIELGPEARLPPTAAPPTPGPQPALPTPPPASPPAPLPEPRWRIGLAAQFLAMTALSDALAPGGAIAVDLRSSSHAFASPSFRAGFVYANAARTTDAEGSARFALLGGQLSACPVRLRVAEGALEPCAAMSAAARLARGGTLRDPDGQTNTRPWVDVGALVRALMPAGDVVWFELAGEAFFPLVRDEFYTFTAGSPLFRVPAAGFRASLGAGVRFP